MDANLVYENHQLDPSTTNIRLLELLDTGTEVIACRFHIENLDRCPPYFALSYTWGVEDDGYKIDIGGYGFLVRKTLRDFLSQARDRQKWYSTVSSPERDHLLWIDAICINQKNIAERNRQVELMGKIYKQVGVSATRYSHGARLTQSGYLCLRLAWSIIKRQRLCYGMPLTDAAFLHGHVRLH